MALKWLRWLSPPSVHARDNLFPVRADITCDFLLTNKIRQRFQNLSDYTICDCDAHLARSSLSCGFEEASCSMLWADCREGHMARNWGKPPSTTEDWQQQETEAPVLTTWKELNSTNDCVSLEVGPSPAECLMRPQPWSTPWLQPCRQSSEASGLF